MGKVATVFPLDQSRKQRRSLCSSSINQNSGVAADVADPDKDGVTNINEYTAGTDPNNSIDFLKFTTAIKTGTTFFAECAGKAGRIYILQRNNELAGGWTSVSSRGPLNADETVSLTDDSAPVDASFLDQGLHTLELDLPVLLISSIIFVALEL